MVKEKIRYKSRVSQGVSVAVAEQAIWDEVELLKVELVNPREFEKIKNQVISNHEFSQMDLLNRAIGLAYHELLGDAEAVNSDIEKYERVQPSDIQTIVKTSLTRENSSTLIYKSKS